MLIVSAVPIMAGGTGDQGDWWMFHHDPLHSGLSPFTGPREPTEEWDFYTLSGIQSSPAIAADGTIYVGSEYFYAVNPTDGSEKWAFDASVYSSPAIGTDGTIYVGSRDHNVYAINPADGSEKWAFTTGDYVGSSPAISSDGNTIYVGSLDHSFYAINTADGSQKWSFATYGWIYSSPAIGTDGTVYVGSADGYLYALDPAEGSKKWAFYTGGRIESSPAISSDGNTIYVGSLDSNTVFAVNRLDGSQKWAFTTGGQIESSPAIGTDGTIYVGSDDGNLYAINPLDGSQKWAFAAGGNVESSPAIGADGTIYVGSYDNNLYAINSNGTQKWAFTTGSEILSSPAIGADGTVYVGSEDGYLYAIGPGSQYTCTVTPSAGSNGAISPDTPQAVVKGGSITFTGTPATGYTVAGWWLDGTVVQSGGTSYTLSNVATDHTVQVTFNILTFTLTPSAGANGAISPNAPKTVTYGASLAFTAIPDKGYYVAGWFVDGSIVPGQTSTAFKLSNVRANHTVSVKFNILVYTLTPSAGPNGAITPDTPKNITYGSAFAFTATPNTGYAVAWWLVDGRTVQNGGKTFKLSNVTANHTVSVVFDIQIFTLTPSAGPNGTMSLDPPKNVIYGSAIAFTATPNTGYGVAWWLVDGKTVQNGGRTFRLSNVTANHAVSVTFDMLIYTLTPSAGPNGAISPDTPKSVTYGSAVLFTATPITGYAPAWWLVDGRTVQNGGTTYKLSNVTASHTVSVVFDILTYTLTPSAGPNGAISPDSAKKIVYGSSLAFTATPKTGYAVGVWLVDGILAQAGGTTFKLSNVVANHSVEVTFVRSPL
jgi:outer membrane protein assembly factor BamB